MAVSRSIQRLIRASGVLLLGVALAPSALAAGLEGADVADIVDGALYDDELYKDGMAEAPISTAPWPLPAMSALSGYAFSIQNVPSTQLNPTGRTMSIVAPLKDRDAFLGDVEIRIGADDAVQVSVEQVFALLARSLDPAAVEPLRLMAEPGFFAPLSSFEQAGLPLTFNPRTLELAVSIPTSARGRQSIGLADLDRELYGDFATPEPFSAFVNFRSAADYVHQGASTGFGDPFVSIDGAARLGGVVFETEGGWNGSDSRFSRSGSRFVIDDAARSNRWTVGDLLPQGRNFQGVQDMAGISVVRSYAVMDPQRNVAPRGGRTFTLERDATVEAIVNGRSVRTIRLQPGTYDVSDFPFVQGSNDVDLVIIDDLGRRDVISFSLFMDRTQLAPGLSEYGFYAGVRTSRSGTGIDYSDDFLASGFYRYGLSDSVTLGGSFQYAEDAGLVAGEAVWGSPLGTVGADVAFSHLDSVGSGWAANISYERLIPGTNGGSAFMAALETRSRYFGSAGQLAPDNPFVYNAMVGFSYSLGDSAFVSAQARYAKGRGPNVDEQSFRLSYGRRLGPSTNLILDADWSDGRLGENHGVRIAFIRRFGDSGTGRAEYDTRSDRVRLGYQTSGGRGVGAWNASGNLDYNNDNYGLNGSASYAANRADLGIAHNTAYSQTANDVTDQRTSLRMSTGVAFAGGRFALGRPINDGFVIVRPYEGARREIIEVEPSRDGYYSRSGALGPALYGQVGSYTPRTITYDAPMASAGFDIGQGSLRLLPPYRAGYVITVGSDYNVTVIGRLLTPGGEPLPLLAGYAYEIGGDERRVDVFTNRQGQFGAAGLKAGRWRIEMPSQPGAVYEFTVPETSDGLARLGDLSPGQ